MKTTFKTCPECGGKGVEEFVYEYWSPRRGWLGTCYDTREKAFNFYRIMAEARPTRTHRITRRVVSEQVIFEPNHKTMTTTKTCPECGKEVEITLHEEYTRNYPKSQSYQDPPYQDPHYSPCCGTSIEIDSSDIKQLLDDAEQAARDWKAEQREDR